MPEYFRMPRTVHSTLIIRISTLVRFPSVCFSVCRKLTHHCLDGLAVDALPALIMFAGPPEYYSTEVDEAGHEVTRRFAGTINATDFSRDLLMRVRHRM
jgi:hypothetical protein